MSAEALMSERFSDGSRGLARLEQMLDTSVLLKCLSQASAPLGAAIQPATASVTRVHARLGGGFVVDAAASGGGRNDRFFIEIAQGEAGAHFEKIQRRITKQAERAELARAHSAPLVYEDAELGVIVRRYGQDELIDGLAGSQSREMMLRQLPDHLAFLCDEGTDRALLGHRLNRRAVLSIESGGKGAVLKLYKKGSGKAQTAMAVSDMLAQTAFGETSPIKVPRTLAALSGWPGYVMEKAAGLPLPELRGAARLAGLGKAGEALGRLHRLPLRQQKTHAAADECELLRAWVKLASSVLPGMRKCLEQAEAHVARDLAAASQPFTMIHRDFHEGQLICSGYTAALIDFDTVCNGEPALDIGNFIAHLEFSGLTGSADAQGGEQLFLASYASAHLQPDAKRVDAWRRASLLRLACLNAFSTQFAVIAPKLAELAAEPGR